MTTHSTLRVLPPPRRRPRTRPVHAARALYAHLEARLRVASFAQTMFNMIEPIDGGKKRLLFLSNSQASLLASDEAHLAKLLDALNVGKPQLVINLLTSGGFRGHTTRYADEKTLQKLSHSDMAGIKYNQPAFLTREEGRLDERKAVERIDNFMAQVLIPLAVQTSAIVLCSADAHECILAASFTRMYAAMKSNPNLIPNPNPSPHP